MEKPVSSDKSYERDRAEGNDSLMRVTARNEITSLSFSQQGFWLLAQYTKASAIHHIPLGFRINGAVDRGAFRRSLNTLFARHEALRSVFVTVDGLPRVRVLPVDTNFPLIEHDLRACSDAESELTRLAREEAALPFDMAKGPLTRGRLVQVTDDEHVCLITQHHIVSDAWSIGVLSRELDALYQAYRLGRADPLPALTIQYPDFAEWQRTRLTGDRLNRQTIFWQKALAGVPPLLELPTDRSRLPQQDFRAAHISLVLDSALTQSLKEVARLHGTTLFVTLLAAWAAVLSRLSGQDDVVIGTPTPYREREETKELIGLFVNTLALRIDFANSPSIGELLLRAHAVLVAAREHEDLPFEQVVAIVQPPRRLNQSPIFQVFFNWNDTSPSWSLSDSKVEPFETTSGVSRFDLNLDLSEHNEVVHGTLIYATSLFDETTMQRHVGYLRAFLHAMVVDSEQAVVDVDLLSTSERTLQLETWGARPAPYPTDRCIHHLFEERVRRTPQAPAVASGHGALSYEELNAQANQLAHHLIHLGVKPDQCVAICVERSIAMVIGLLAILKAGGAYVPLDPTYPSERLSQILADAAPTLLLIDAAGRTSLGESSLARHITVDMTPLHEHACATTWSSAPASDPDIAELTSRHLAYVIYTSGSTGAPKGVMIEHENLVCYTLGAIELFRLGSPDRVFQQNTLNFDLSVEEIFPSLLSGATLVISSEMFGADGDRPSPLLPTFVHFTTAHWNTLVSEWSRFPGLAHKQLSGVRLINVTGDAISQLKLQMWTAICPRQVHLVNTYGPTEATVSCTADYLEQGSTRTITMSGSVTIGRPMANARVYLLDSNRQPVPLGVTGELYVGGKGVARGYVNRPDLTSERFLPDPFSPVRGARMYRTGDLARYLPNGNLEFLGRNDSQVKVRGFRVEPSEIEARLLEYPGISEAVVIPREDVSGEKRLIAYVVLPGESPPDLMKSLRVYLSARLPDYMVPAAFVQLDALPLTPNGKLDRAGLRAPRGDSRTYHTFEPPQGELEQALAELWCELLTLERISRHDSFFELGGKSLSAMDLIIRAQKTFHCDVALRDLFSEPSLIGFAAVIQANQLKKLGQHEAPNVTG